MLSNAGYLDVQSPYFDQQGSLERFDGTNILVRLTTTAPPANAGEDLVVHEPIDQLGKGRQAWQYLVGQRRVRRVPTLTYDSLSPFTSGSRSTTRPTCSTGRSIATTGGSSASRRCTSPTTRTRSSSKTIGQALGPAYPNPDHLRWELHRVWVVEATVAPGKQHAMPRRRFYLDEDTWIILLADGWNAQGKLWHVEQALPFVAPDVPGVFLLPFVVFDSREGWLRREQPLQRGQAPLPDRAPKTGRLLLAGRPGRPRHSLSADTATPPRAACASRGRHRPQAVA